MKNIKETIKSIIREESEYETFFRKALDKAGKGIADMSDAEKKAFFTKIDNAWTSKGEKNEGNAFGAAVVAAKKAGEEEFEVDGKTYKVEENLNEEKYTVIDPKGNQMGASDKGQAVAIAKKKGGEKEGYFVVSNKNALKARRALEKFKGDFKNPKLKDMMADLFYESVEEASTSSAPGEWVAYLSTTRGKKLLKTFDTARGAKMFLSKNVDKLLGGANVESVGIMTKKQWDEREAKYAIEGVVSEGKLGDTWRKNNKKGYVLKVGNIELKSAGPSNSHDILINRQPWGTFMMDYEAGGDDWWVKPMRGNDFWVDSIDDIVAKVKTDARFSEGVNEAKFEPNFAKKIEAIIKRELGVGELKVSGPHTGRVMNRQDYFFSIDNPTHKIVVSKKQFGGQYPDTYYVALTNWQGRSKEETEVNNIEDENEVLKTVSSIAKKYKKQLTYAAMGETKSVNELKKLPNGNFSIKVGYPTFADYEKKAKVGDTILKYDKRGGMIKTFVDGSELNQNAEKYLDTVNNITNGIVYLSKKGMKGVAQVPDYEKKEVGVLVLEAKSVNEGIWPKSKLKSDTFEFALAAELKKNFKGIFYVVGHDLYHNDKKVLTIDGDKDSINVIVKKLKSTIKEVSVNEGVNEAIGDKDLPNWLFDDPIDFEDWYEDGMELANNKGKLAPFSSSDEKKLFQLVGMWQDAEGDYQYGRGDLGTGKTTGARSASYSAQDLIKKFLTQKGKIVKTEGNAFGAAVVAAKKAGEDEFEVDGKTFKVENELPKATIPAAVQAKLDMAIDKIKDTKLSYNQKLSLIGKVMDGLGVDKGEFNKMASKLKGTMESVNENFSADDIAKIKKAVEDATSFMGIGAELKKAGIKYGFSTEPFALYMIKKGAKTFALINKRYADNPDFVVGSTAGGIMESVITEALVPVDKKAVDAFFDKKPFEGKNLNSDGKVLKTVGVGSQEMFIHTPNGVKFVGKITGQYAQSVVQYVTKNFKGDLTEIIKSYKPGDGEYIAKIYSGHLKGDERYSHALTVVDVLHANGLVTKAVAKQMEQELANSLARLRKSKSENVNEGNAFGMAVSAAKKEGLKEFEFNGKMYKVKKGAYEKNELAKKLAETEKWSVVENTHVVVSMAKNGYGTLMSGAVDMKEAEKLKKATTAPRGEELQVITVADAKNMKGKLIGGKTLK